MARHGKDRARRCNEGRGRATQGARGEEVEGRGDAAAKDVLRRLGPRGAGATESCGFLGGLDTMDTMAL